MKFTTVQLVLMRHLVSSEIVAVERRHKRDKKDNRFARNMDISYINDLKELEEKLREH